jgi:transcriptional regulator with XRE-family HTH domain
MKHALPRHNANPLIDAAIKALGVRSDAKLAHYLGMSPPYLSKVRHGKLAAGPTLLVLLSEAMDVPTKQLKALMVEVV